MDAEGRRDLYRRLRLSFVDDVRRAVFIAGDPLCRYAGDGNVLIMRRWIAGAISVAPPQRAVMTTPPEPASRAGNERHHADEDRPRHRAQRMGIAPTPAR